MKNVLIRALALVALASWVAPASAAITFNYDQRWLFDSMSGLYWQMIDVPSDTLIPSTGTIPESDQLVELLSHAGVTGYHEFQPYSKQIADLVAFFATNAPAPPRHPQTRFISFDENFGGLYSYPFDLPRGGFQYMGFFYAADYYYDPSIASWDSKGWYFDWATTIGTYGPGHACPQWWESGCPETIKTFVYSDVQPVPLPASVFLFLSGAALLGHKSRRRMSPSTSAR